MTDNREVVEFTYDELQRAIANLRSLSDNPQWQINEFVLPLRPDVFEKLKAEGWLVPMGGGWSFVWDLEDDEG